MKKVRLLALVIPIAFACLAIGLLVDYLVSVSRSRAHLRQSWQTLFAAAASVSETDRTRLLERNRQRGWWYTDPEWPVQNSNLGVIK